MEGAAASENYIPIISTKTFELRPWCTFKSLSSNILTSRHDRKIQNIDLESALNSALKNGLKNICKFLSYP